LAHYSCSYHHSQLCCFCHCYGHRPYCFMEDLLSPINFPVSLWVYLSRPADGHLSACRRNFSGRHMGELLLGAVLGLGSKGNMGSDHTSHLPGTPSWTYRTPMGWTWTGCRCHYLLSLCPNGLVWS